MKKLLLSLAMIVLISSTAFAQEKSKNPIALKVAPAQIEQKLSTTHQKRLQILRASEDYLSIQIIDASNVTEAIKSGEIEFDIPGKLGRIKPQTQSLTHTTASDFQYNGKFKGGEAILISENGRTYGQIRNKGDVYDIQYLENGYATLIEYNMEKLNQMSCATTEEIHETHIDQNKHNDLENQNDLENDGSIEARNSPNPRVRVLVLFTAAAANTGLNMNDLANTARAQWLSASINSQVVSSLIIAGVEPLNFSETNGSIGLDINRLRNNIQAQQLRNNFEADIVLLLTSGNYSGYGGIVADIGPSEDDAYGIVQVANATSTITWAHETAHLFGARHQFAADNTPGDAHGHDWLQGIWPFRNKYGSIMRTLQQGRERVLHFSNPNVTHEGQATGVTGISYNTKAINVNGRVVEDFRFTQPDLAVSIYGPSTANNGDALSFFANVSNSQGIVSYQWRVNTGTGYYTVGSGSSLNFSMPAGEDLEVMLYVSDGNGGAASDYHFVRNMFLGGGPCTICPDSTLMDAIVKTDLELENNLETDKILVYPNPTATLLSYSLPLSESKTTVQIINLNGTLIREKQFQFIDTENSLQSLNIADLKSGVYFLKIKSFNGLEESIRFIKE